MKTKKYIIVAVISSIVSIFSLSATNETSFEKANKLSDIESIEALEQGDILVQTCLKCDSVSVAQIQNMEQLKHICKDGTHLDCPSCGNSAKIVRTGPPSKGKTSFKIVDDHGDQCMILSASKTEKIHKHKHKI